MSDVTQLDIDRLFEGFRAHAAGINSLRERERPSREWFKQLLTEYEQALDHIDSQRAELEAAREVVERARYMTYALPREAPSVRDTVKAIEDYDARTGCYDPWGLERSREDDST